MRQPIDIIAGLYTYNLRKNTGTYTFGFTEDNVKFCYHNHLTGRRLEMWLLDPEHHVSSLYVYYNTEWYYPRYIFNEIDKVQGFQVDGPWVQKINSMLEVFEVEIAREIKVREEAKREQLAQEKLTAEQKLKYYRDIT